MEARRERQRLNTFALVLIAAVAAAVALSELRTVLVPFVLALFLHYLLLPLVDTLQLRCRVPRAVAMVFAVVIVNVAVAALVAFIISSIGGFEERAALYQERLVLAGERVTVLLNDLGINIAEHTLVDALEQLPLREMATQAVGSVLGIIGNAVLTLIFTIYLVAGRAPNTKRPGFWGEIDETVQRYIVTKIHTSVATGVLVGLTLWIFGVEFALLFGLLTALLFFIPTVGSIIATVLPLPIIILQFDSVATIVGIFAILIVLMQVIGNVIEPKLMGKGLDLHPVTVLLALALWGLIWGIVGMLLSAPLMAIVKILLDRYQTTRPVAEILAGRIGAGGPPTDDGPEPAASPL